MPEFASSELLPASGDASFRRYFRVQSGQHSRIAMDAPPPQEDCEPFVRIAGYLSDMGLNGPEVFEADIERGFLLLSDFGKQRYLDELSARPEVADILYRNAIDALCTLQREGEKFSKSFIESVQEFYDEWVEENGGTLPNFEDALERAKSEGVAPQPGESKSE